MSQNGNGGSQVLPYKNENGGRGGWGHVLGMPKAGTNNCHPLEKKGGWGGGGGGGGSKTFYPV